MQKKKKRKKVKKPNHSVMGLFLLVFVLWVTTAHSVRLKDLASIKGVRENQLWGYGLVVGLAGTGDSRHEVTETSLNMLLKGLDVDLKSKKVETKNTAAVLVTAKLPPFSGTGSKMDVTVSSIGSASSLEGGTLVVTPLKGADGEVYAIAQGKVVTSLRTGKGTKFLRQSLVTAQIPNGALLEKELKFDFRNQKKLRFLLNSPDFTTAARVTKRINEEMGAHFAHAVDAGTVDVIFPESYTGNPVHLVARIENVDVEADGRARIVINQRTGTVIMGQNVRISPAAIAHNNLRIEIEPSNPAANAEENPPPVVDPNAPLDPTRQLSSLGRDIDSGSNAGSVLPFKGGASVADIASSLSNLGASPDDLILILQALKASGALTAEVVTK